MPFVFAPGSYNKGQCFVAFFHCSLTQLLPRTWTIYSITTNYATHFSLRKVTGIRVLCTKLLSVPKKLKGTKSFMSSQQLSGLLKKIPPFWRTGAFINLSKEPSTCYKSKSDQSNIHSHPTDLKSHFSHPPLSTYVFQHY